jgi:hypothetical protein
MNKCNRFINNHFDAPMCRFTKLHHGKERRREWGHGRKRAEGGREGREKGEVVRRGSERG